VLLVCMCWMVWMAYVWLDGVCVWLGSLFTRRDRHIVCVCVCVCIYVRVCLCSVSRTANKATRHKTRPEHVRHQEKTKQNKNTTTTTTNNNRISHQVAHPGE
jgi:hypothetical protein